MVAELLESTSEGGLPNLEYVVRCADGETPTGAVAYASLAESDELGDQPEADVGVAGRGRGRYLLRRRQFERRKRGERVRLGHALAFTGA